MIHAKSLAQRLAYVPLLVVGLVLGQSGEAGADDPASCNAYRLSTALHTRNADGSFSIYVEITSKSGPVAEDTYVNSSCWFTTGEQLFRLETPSILIRAGEKTGSGTVLLIPITEEEPEENDGDSQGTPAEDDGDSQSTTTGSQSTTTGSQSTTTEGDGASAEGQTVPSLYPQTLATSGEESTGTSRCCIGRAVRRCRKGSKRRLARRSSGRVYGDCWRGNPVVGHHYHRCQRSQATTTLTLGSEPGTNTVEASVEGLESGDL